MAAGTQHPRLATAVRWVARVWSAILLVFAVLMTIVPDPNTVRPMPLGDLVAVGLMWLAVLALVAAWRWEAPGGTVALGAALALQLSFVIDRGIWHPAVGTLGLVFGLPAVLYLVSWTLRRRDDRA